jgi:hypothetical protein
MARSRSRYRRRADSRLVMSAVAAGLVLAFAVSHTHASTAAGGGAAGVPAAAVSGGTLDCRQLEALWESAEIATAESSGQQYATDDDGNGTTDEGYWQINTSHGSLATYDAYGNARAAVLISDDGTDWSPWVTYQTGAYAGQC